MDRRQSPRNRTCLLSIPLQFDSDAEDAPSDHGNNDLDELITAPPTIRLCLHRSWQRFRRNNADPENNGMHPVNLHFRHRHGQESIVQEVFSPSPCTNQGVLLQEEEEEEDSADWRSGSESVISGSVSVSSNNSEPPASPVTIAFEPVHLLQYPHQQRASPSPSPSPSPPPSPSPLPLPLPSQSQSQSPLPSRRLRSTRWLVNIAALALMCFVLCFAQWTIEKNLISSGAVPPCIFHPSSSPHRNLTTLALAYVDTTTHLLEPVGLPRTSTCRLAGNDPQTALLASDADLPGLLHPSTCQTPVVFFDPVQVLHDFAAAITDLCVCVPERSTHLLPLCWAHANDSWAGRPYQFYSPESHPTAIMLIKLLENLADHVGILDESLQEGFGPVWFSTHEDDKSYYNNRGQLVRHYPDAVEQGIHLALWTRFAVHEWLEYAVDDQDMDLARLDDLVQALDSRQSYIIDWVQRHIDTGEAVISKRLPHEQQAKMKSCAVAKEKLNKGRLLDAFTAVRDRIHTAANVLPPIFTQLPSLEQRLDTWVLAAIDSHGYTQPIQIRSNLDLRREHHRPIHRAMRFFNQMGAIVPSWAYFTRLVALLSRFFRADSENGSRILHCMVCKPSEPLFDIRMGIQQAIEAIEAQGKSAVARQAAFREWHKRGLNFKEGV